MSSKLLPGFTLVELLIVIAILAILSTLGISNFQSARIKARDLSRKSDLQTIAKSLEAYVNDHRAYPLSDVDHKIVCKTGTSCNWGSPFTDDTGTVYTAALPTDPIGATYQYISTTGSSYTLYAHIENTQDPTIIPGLGISCGSLECNYKVTSSNIQ